MSSLFSLISSDVPVLRLADTVAHALALMDDYNLACLPVVSYFDKEGVQTDAATYYISADAAEPSTKYLGQLSQNNLLNVFSTSSLISELALEGEDAFLASNAHWLDALKVCAFSPVGMIALSDEFDGSFLGCILSNNLLDWLAKSYAISQIGGILELLINERDYSLSQISRLVESNGIKIIYASVMTLSTEPDKLLLILKFNIADISPAVATLERFGYQIYGRYYESENKNIDKERLDILLKYLSI